VGAPTRDRRRQVKPVTGRDLHRHEAAVFDLSVLSLHASHCDPVACHLLRSGYMSPIVIRLHVSHCDPVTCHPLRSGCMSPIAIRLHATYCAPMVPKVKKTCDTAVFENVSIEEAYDTVRAQTERSGRGEEPDDVFGYQRRRPPDEIRKKLPSELIQVTGISGGSQGFQAGHKDFKRVTRISSGSQGIQTNERAHGRPVLQTS
jgi:hypothetical protein